MMKLISHRGDHFHRCFLSVSGHSQGETGPWEIGLGYNQRAETSIQQPLAYDGYYWVLFDGSISNRQNLYQTLGNAGYRFRTNQDSEIILVAYLHWGLGAFQEVKGKWSVVITDLVQKRAVLSRDTVGAKPLYFRQDTRGLSIASEIKQFRALGSFALDQSALIHWLATNSLKPGETMFSMIRELLPGCVLTYSLVDFKIETETPYPFQIRSLSEFEDTHSKAKFLRDEVLRETRNQVSTNLVWSAVDDGTFPSFVLHDALSVSKPRFFKTHCPVFAGHNTDMSEYLNQFVMNRGGQTNFYAPDERSFDVFFDRFVFAAETPVVDLQMFVNFLVGREISQSNFQLVFGSYGVDQFLHGGWKAYCAALDKQLLGADPLHGLTEILGALLAGGNRDLFWQYNASLLHRLSKSESILSKNGKRLVREYVTRLSQTAKVPREDQNRRNFAQSLVTLEKCFSASGIELVHPFAVEAFVFGASELDVRDLYRNGWSQYVLRLGFSERLPSSLAWNRRDAFRNEMLLDWFTESIASNVERLVGQRDAKVWSIYAHSRCLELLKSSRGVRANRRTALGQLLQVFSVARWLDVFELN